MSRHRRRTVRPHRHNVPPPLPPVEDAILAGALPAALLLVLIIGAAHRGGSWPDGPAYLTDHTPSTVKHHP